MTPPEWLPWRRHRRTEPGLEPRQLADAWQVCSLLLDYPDQDLLDRRATLREVTAGLPAAVSRPLLTFIDGLAGATLRDLQSTYVDTFDVTRKCCLHLTFFTHGDTRKRGVALVQFKQTYGRAGLVIADTELPDHLCVLLEFGAAHDPAAAWKLLNDYRVGIELLHRALLRRGSAWADVISALRATLPGLDGDDAAALQRLIAQGPPQEQVGLEGYPAFDPTPPPPPRPVDLGASIAVGVPR